MTAKVVSEQELQSILGAGRAFLYNDFGGPGSGRGNILHRASCAHVRRSNLSIRKWAFDSRDEAAEWLSANRGAEGVMWTACRFCLGPSSATPIRAIPSAKLAPSPLPTLEQLRETIGTYRSARQAFLTVLGIPASNRDPLSEFCERLVAVIVGGRLADSRVEKGYDVLSPEGRRVQVKYVANPAGEWINGHTVRFDGGADDYALVLVEDLEPRAVVVFAAETLGRLAAALAKRHPNQDVTLQLTKANLDAIRVNPNDYAKLGVRVAESPGWRLNASAETG